MEKLINLVKYALKEKKSLPFSAYSCLKEQNIFNVPIIKPILIVILSGKKILGQNNEVICSTGSFIFLSNSPTIDMRNIPNDHEYFALLIEFDYQDFNFLKERAINSKKYIRGKVDLILEKTLQQFVEWSLFSPVNMWSHRRQEILQILYHLGYREICSIAKATSISNKIHKIVSENISADFTMNIFCKQLAMSESTIRRKLKLEGTSIKKIKNQVKLGHALHLVQTTSQSIGHISELCGYQSQSRFTDKFKQLFGLTPTQLRKTRMND